MNISRSIVTAFAILSCSLMAQEELSPLETKEKAAFAKAEGNDVKERETTVWAEKFWDDELNKIYKSLTAGLKGKALESLKKSQRQWIVFRDAEFERLDSYQEGMSGSMWNNIFRYAKVRVTKTRTLELEKMLGLLENYSADGN